MDGSFGHEPDTAAMGSDAAAGPLTVTLFRNFAATEKVEETITLRTLAERIARTSAPTKAALPWLKLASFGDLRTDKRSLRHDANVLSISGIEVDYDGEQVAFDAALEVLTKADLLALVYTSPSHTPAKPRWRVLCPTSTEMPPAARSHLLGRLNGLFGGIFSTESWTLSQAYYFGSVGQNPDHRVEVVDGTAVDLLDDLDETWRGKPNTASGTTVEGKPRHRPLDEAALLEEIRSGASYHAAAVRLLGRWARDGLPYLAARQRLRDAMEGVFPPDRDARWHARFADIDRCLEDIYVKEAGARDRGERPPHPSRRPGSAATGNAAADLDWPEPIDFLADDAVTGPPELRPEHLPDALWPFVTDSAERMGLDPCTMALVTLGACAAVTSDDWRLQPKAHDWSWDECPRI